MATPLGKLCWQLIPTAYITNGVGIILFCIGSVPYWICSLFHLSSIGSFLYCMWSLLFVFSVVACVLSWACSLLDLSSVSRYVSIGIVSSETAAAVV